MKNYKKIGIIKSKGRLINEPNSPYRSPFQRDRDRIIHSTAFRRLKHKTQVFVNTEGTIIELELPIQSKLPKLQEQYLDI